MKFLCVCHYGHSRSVAMARAFHASNIEAVAMGVGTAPSALQPLAGWADLIVAMDRGIFHRLRQMTEGGPHAGSVVLFDVGPDRWSNPYNAELRSICEAKVPELVAQAQKLKG